MLRLPHCNALPFLLSLLTAAASPFSEEPWLQLPANGEQQLRILTPSILELTLVLTRDSPTSSLGPWNFVTSEGQLRLPETSEFLVKSRGERRVVKQVGFKRRVIYAPINQRDLRVANTIYLELKEPVTLNAEVSVENPSRKLWSEKLQFKATANSWRFSPLIHVNQTGYSPRFPAVAMVGYFLGSMGELRADQLGIPSLSFRLLNAKTGKEVFIGKLTTRRDHGFPYPEYQEVLQADFSAFKTLGQYRLSLEGVGVSSPFFIREDIVGSFARTYALGIYHQRCGAANALPFTRFTHGPCHTGLVEVPSLSKKFEAANFVLGQESHNARDNERHTARLLKDIGASLYPFVNKGPLAVRGGHHDAGDYSKYTINSASFIHHLMCAVDAFDGVEALDNLGLPESGDEKSDVLQLAKWEADFLATMQDEDGGFYFLVYPLGRRYEDNVLPDAGDPQVVFPKTTSVTAAATAALAQCASSPTMKDLFPESAALYLQKAKKGWQFLENAIARYGKDGAYQKITHYGDEFMHDDELSWAACELFLATGESAYHERVLEWLKPNEPGTRKWGWWRLFDAYGCAIRSYALAEKAGKSKSIKLNQDLQRQCEDELISAAQEQLTRSEQSAYGTSFPVQTKRARSAGWYFPEDAAFDLVAACQLEFPSKRDPRPRFLAAIISNLNYQQGCNPVNITYLTGLGYKRQREIVHQYAKNDRRTLPPSGIPLGSIQGGFGWLDLYKKEPGSLSYPPDDSGADVYPFYDRWSDAFNLTQEFVILHQARGLAFTAWLMAQTDLRKQAWRPMQAQIRLQPRKDGEAKIFQLEAASLDLNEAMIVWEGEGIEPVIASELNLDEHSLAGEGGAASRGLERTRIPRGQTNPSWIEAEAMLPDGRRIFGVLSSNQK